MSIRNMHLGVLACVMTAAPPAVGDDVIFVSRAQTSHFVPFSASDGTQLESPLIYIVPPISSQAWPRSIIRQDDELWVADTLGSWIRAFDLDGNHVRDVLNLGSPGDLLVVGDRLYTTTTFDGVRMFQLPDLTEITPATFVDAGDIIHHNGSLLVATFDTVDRYDLDMNLLSTFAGGDGTISRLFDLSSRPNGNVLVASGQVFGGVYEYLPDGTPLGRVAFSGGSSRALGVSYLDNGDIFWTRDSSVYINNVQTTDWDDLTHASRVSLDASCDVDLNGDGTSDIDDLLAFLSAWFASDSDFDGDGDTDIDDLLGFLAGWFAGC